MERRDTTTVSAARLQGSEWLWKLLPAGVLNVFVVVTAASNFAKFKAGHLACIISLALPSLTVRCPLDATFLDDDAPTYTI